MLTFNQTQLFMYFILMINLFSFFKKENKQHTFHHKIASLSSCY